MPVPLAPADSTFYTANTIYGQGTALGKGFVVYNGTGRSATITGLQPNTYYYITNAEYNTDGTSIAYNNRSSSMAISTRAVPVSPAPLAVELTAFAGTIDANSMALLQWSTATERNTSYFAVERSSDGVYFSEANRMAAAGTSSQSLAYHWPDSKRLTQPTYYRLRQVDLDGTVHYSSSIVLSPVPLLARRVEIYPNPSVGKPVQLLLQGFAGETLTLQIADALGRPISIQTLAPMTAQSTTPLPLPTSLAAGTYFITLASSDGPVQKRLIVSN
ncbi:T9SS type A sorting domain-containing protein [Hymenobacter sp. PAMC 26628]|uniref:T9SS type A sorting domain-containing protein n=1 Tax=Hymenobacter sp. PAMC 26628 TaxID=1484118 RepID=UPI0012FFB222|nr:T9SS type A sorting domain-containing protein [Hymenobacter sp. PAMC 26628]